MKKNSQRKNENWNPPKWNSESNSDYDYQNFDDAPLSPVGGDYTPSSRWSRSNNNSRNSYEDQ